jgi:hypothetical protein
MPKQTAEEKRAIGALLGPPSKSPREIAAQFDCGNVFDCKLSPRSTTAARQILCESSPMKEIPLKWRWTFALPAVHVCMCFVSAAGWLIPALSFLAFPWTGLMMEKLPPSLLAYFLAWRYPFAAGVWILVAGTAWWYLLSLGVQRLKGSASRVAYEKQ